MVLMDLAELYSEAVGRSKRAAASVLVGFALAAPALGQPGREAERPAIFSNESFSERFSWGGEAVTVRVGREEYRAYRLFTREPVLPESPQPWDFSVTSPWLVLEGNGDPVLDENLAERVGYAANLSRRAGELARQLGEEAGRYRDLRAQAAVPEAVLLVARPVSSGLYAILGLKAAGIPAAEGALDMARGAAESIALEALDTHLKARARDPEAAGSAQVFRLAMYGLLEEAEGELRAAARELESLERPTVGAAERAGRKIVRAKTKAHAALMGLLTYFGNEPSQGAWNFFLEQVAQPAVGAAGADLEGFVRIHGEALGAWRDDVRAAGALFEGVYGKKGTEKGQELVLGIVQGIEVERAEQAFREKLGGGFGEVWETYRQLRKAALAEGSGIEEKKRYVFFLTGLLSSAYSLAVPVEGWEEALETRRRLAPLPPEEFVREYDRLAREAILQPGKGAAFAGAANLILPYLERPTVERPSQLFSAAERQPLSFDAEGFHRLYRESLEMAERHIAGLEGAELSPGQRARLEEDKRVVEKLRTYERVFQGGELSGTDQLTLQLLFRHYMGRLESEPR